MWVGKMSRLSKLVKDNEYMYVVDLLPTINTPIVYFPKSQGEKLMMTSLRLALLLAAILAEQSAAKDCVNRCGDLIIERPFGIGPNCGKSEFFELTCKPSSSSSNPKPILTKLNLELLSYQSNLNQITVNFPVAKACADRRKHEAISWSSLNLSGSPFKLDYGNVFGSIGCHGFSSLYDAAGGVISGCTSTCDPAYKVAGCNGYGCCRSSIPNYYEIITISVKASVSEAGSCRSAFIVSEEYLNSNATLVSATAHPLLLPFLLTWRDTYSLSTSAIFFGGFAFFSAYIVPPLLTCGCLWSCWFCKTKNARKAAKIRSQYFKGRLEQTSSREPVYVTKLFTKKEIKIATHNFNGDRILGEGGQGTVYKGMLPNGKIVAVKRSKAFEESQWNQFINEVILLSQMNHKNIVKLLGCCLETKTPYVVYEFISKGTLSQHIHNATMELVPKWDMRIKIAFEAADAIAYLHSSSSLPIYHRDIKSCNILLDDELQAKVSDFGISKAIPTDQTHLTTCVRGTFGYLDPEYFRSGQFSEKSDVYSFGVILVELLTREHPIRVTATNEDERSLVEYFISSMNRFGLDKILDPLILEESAKEDVILVANLAKRCLNSRGTKRPTMREVAMKLEGLHKKLFTYKEITTKKFPLQMEHVSSMPTTMIEHYGTTLTICESVNSSQDDWGGEQPLIVAT